MKKTTISCMMFFILLIFCSCNTKHLSVEQSNKNFAIYEKHLQNVASEYDCNFEKINTLGLNSTDSAEFSIIDNNSEIIVWIGNSSLNNDKGVESFFVEYSVEKEELCYEGYELNLNLFVDLVNCISGKKISVELCKNFLDAPEDEYSAEDYGIVKQEGENIKKVYPLNFFEDWNLFFTSTQEKDILCFGGLSLQLSK